MESIPARFNRRVKFRNQHLASPDKRHSYGRNIALLKDGLTPILALIFEKIGQGALLPARSLLSSPGRDLLGFVLNFRVLDSLWNLMGRTGVFAGAPRVSCDQ
jgi:hypothetical protein